IILFGSYAYGTPHEDSDIDLFFCVYHPHRVHLRGPRKSAMLSGVTVSVSASG
ncbi:MAG: nucleotidyltransferase domain-containing protein, partial [Deltaproteobacteria bacterium]|nr:nucleotidyltransferase domain-containing protein [Candidatus Anaeroferrophillacea bacterium]